MYYKVVRQVNGGSYGSSVARGNHEVVYVPNKWSKPVVDCSKLFVFDNFDDAKEHIEWMSAQNAFMFITHIVFELWECEVENPVYVPNRLISTDCNTKNVIMFWKNGCVLDPDDIITRVGIPLKGTVCVDKVKITKKWLLVNRDIEL